LTQKALYKLLEQEVLKRDHINELTLERPDPLLVAKVYQDEYIALICALFAYGNASLIVKFLQRLDFSLLGAREDIISKELSSFYYRFQNSEDVIALFLMLKRAKAHDSLESMFLKGYNKEHNILDGLSALIHTLKNLYPYESRGYQFLLSRPPMKNTKSTYKRWNMYLRWMVRSDHLDLGLWKHVDKKNLLMPLDTHTFRVSQKLGLLKRKSYDLKAVVELTHALQKFDPNDPVKYDFALYRIGQEKLLATIK